MTDAPNADGAPADERMAAAPSEFGGRLPAEQPYAQQIAALQPVQAATGPIGKVRGTGFCILMTVITFGIYSLVWYYQTHDEMKRHTNEGLGGGLALVLSIFVGVVMPFLTSSEVGNMYERRNEAKPVSGSTGLWSFPGFLLLGIGPIVWFVKTNGALNNYWRSLGAR